LADHGSVAEGRMKMRDYYNQIIRVIIELAVVLVFAYGVFKPPFPWFLPLYIAILTIGAIYITLMK
jgi:hypothetical protein